MKTLASLYDEQSESRMSDAGITSNLGLRGFQQEARTCQKELLALLGSDEKGENESPDNAISPGERHSFLFGFYLHSGFEPEDVDHIFRAPRMDVDALPALSEVDMLALLPQKASFEAYAPQPPDISEGLGSVKKNIDLVALAKYAQSTLSLMFYRGSLYCYEPPCWQEMTEHAFEVKIRRVFEPLGLTDALTTSEYRRLYALLKTEPAIQWEHELPSHAHLLNLRDGTLDVMSMELRPHSARDAFLSYLDVAYHDMVEAEGPAFERFVSCASAGNPDVRVQLLELISIAIMGAEVKAFYVALGPSGTGKSQFGRFLAELLGHDQVTTIRSMSDFGDKFSLGDIEHKKMVMCLDLPDAPLPPAAIGMTLQLVGDDALRSERKYKDPSTIYRKPLFFCAGNHPLRLPHMEREDALLRRMVVIPLVGAVTEDDIIPQFYKVLLREAPYIVREAMRAYRDLLERGMQPTRTTVPEEYDVRDSRQAYNDVAQFIKTQCAEDADADASTQALYAAYQDFSEAMAPISLITFSRLFAEAIQTEIPSAKVAKRTSDGSRGYKGISLR